VFIFLFLEPDLSLKSWKLPLVALGLFLVLEPDLLFMFYRLVVEFESGLTMSLFLEPLLLTSLI
jgi:hypothetical protein